MSHLLHSSIQICLLITMGYTCATEQWKWADGDTDCAVTVHELCRPLQIEYNFFDEAMHSNCLGENYEWYTTIQYDSLFLVFFFFF